jgi:hypothetical protein
MAKIIANKVKAAAIREYVHNNKSLREVSETHGINIESLRKFLGNKVRPRGTRYLSDGSVKTPGIKNGRKERTSKVSSATPNSNRRWTRSEDEMLREAVISKMTVKETMDLLGRTPASLYSRKCHLINSGFIKDPEMRFVVPAGITRVRRPMEHAMDTPECEAVVEKEITSPSTGTISNTIELIQLAQIVKDYGVNITVSVTSSGTEVKMSK